MKPIALHDNNHKPDTSAPHGSEQVLAALDAISVKLIKSEAERETMRREIDKANSANDKLQRTLESNHKSLQETRDRLDNSLRDLDLSKSRQERLDEKLRDAQTQMTTLARKLEAEEKRRLRLYRRMERLETMAKSAQAALEAKAMVLLTDRTLAVDSGRPMLETTATAKEITTPTEKPPFEIRDVEPNILPPYDLNESIVPATTAPRRIGWPIFALGGALLLVLGWQGAMLVTKLSQDKPAAPQAQVILQPETAPTVATEPHLEPAVTSDTLVADPNLPEAFKALEQKALVEKNPAAMHDLATLYIAGRDGTDRDYARAKALFAESAKGGVANAAYNLGVIAHQGLGTKKDEQLAQAWYLTAALSQHPEAMYNLGISRIEGSAVAYNPQLAAWYFAEAALGGVAEAAYNLGLIFDNGLLGESRSDLALLWYRLGASLGHKESQNQFDTIVSREHLDATTAGLLPDGTALDAKVSQIKAAAPTDRATETDTVLKAMPDMQRLLMDRNQVITSEIETLLTTRGLYKGPVDGMANQQLRDAINTYQKQQALPRDGQPNATLLGFMLSEQIAALK